MCVCVYVCMCVCVCLCPGSIKNGMAPTCGDLIFMHKKDEEKVERIL